MINVLNDILTEIRNANYWLRQHAHWGLWNDTAGWWRDTTLEIFNTASRAVAEVQCKYTNEVENAWPPGVEWCVKCFEEWADERDA